MFLIYNLRSTQHTTTSQFTTSHPKIFLVFNPFTVQLCSVHYYLSLSFNSSTFHGWLPIFTTTTTTITTVTNVTHFTVLLPKGGATGLWTGGCTVWWWACTCTGAAKGTASGTSTAAGTAAGTRSLAAARTCTGLTVVAYGVAVLRGHVDRTGQRRAKLSGTARKKTARTCSASHPTQTTHGIGWIDMHRTQ